MLGHSLLQVYYGFLDYPKVQMFYLVSTFLFGKPALPDCKPHPQITCTTIVSDRVR